MGARENECQISQNYILQMKFSEFYLFFHNSCETGHVFIFLESHEKFSLVLLQMINYIFSPWGKKVKMNAIFFKFFWYEVFVH